MGKGAQNSTPAVSTAPAGADGVAAVDWKPKQKQAEVLVDGRLYDVSKFKVCGQMSSSPIQPYPAQGHAP